MFRHMEVLEEKAYTQCSVAVSSIHQSITIEKMGFFGFERVGPIFTDGNSNASYFIQNNAGIVCTNLKSTLWTFVVTVEVLYQGNYYYATTNAAHGPTSFPCGT